MQPAEKQPQNIGDILTKKKKKKKKQQRGSVEYDDTNLYSFCYFVFI